MSSLGRNEALLSYHQHMHTGQDSKCACLRESTETSQDILDKAFSIGIRSSSHLGLLHYYESLLAVKQAHNLAWVFIYK